MTTTLSKPERWVAESAPQPCLCPDCGSNAIEIVHDEAIQVWGCWDCGARWSERS